MDVDLVSGLIRVDSDRPWRDAEARLGRSGHTLGWVPPVGPGDTVGELLIRGADGLRSGVAAGPGAACVGVEAVIGGRVERTPIVPRSAAGADFQHVILGAGGAHAPLRAAWLRFVPRPEASLGLRARFLDGASAAPALAGVLQRGAIPAFALLDVTAQAVVWDLVFEGPEPLARARWRTARRMLEAAEAELLDDGAPVARLASLGRQVTAGQTPDALPWGATLDLAAPWSCIGRAADAILERLPEARMAIAFPTQTGARLLVAGVDAPSLPRALGLAVAAGARPRERGSLVDQCFAGSIGSLADAQQEGTR